MVLKKTGKERRRDPRVDNQIPVKIYHEDGDIVTETGNVSRSGISLKINKYIDPMTKLKVNLLLPLKKNGKLASKKIHCQGVVVRVENGKDKNVYNVAIFFNDISQRDAEVIADYVSNFLEDHNLAI